MTQPEHLTTWEGVMGAADLEALLARVETAVLIGQRAGDFTLARRLEGGVASWPSGRCFNEALEIRWWPADEGDERGVLILNRLPEGWPAPDGWERTHPLAQPPDRVSYLCAGHYDYNGGEGVHEWWEARYGRAFHYLESAPPAASGDQGGAHVDGRGRVHLVVMAYELVDGRTQHRLMRFEHARPEGGAS